MNKINLDDPNNFGLGIEKEETYDEIYHAKGWIGRLVMKLIGRVRYFPQVSFQKEDIDEKVIAELIKHNDLLRAVERWITHTDYTLLSTLQRAKKVFEAIQKPKPRQLLYRGFPSSNKGIEEKFKELNVGESFTYVPDKMLSFSFHKGTTEDFGDVIVSVEYEKEKHRMLHITHEIVVAYLVRDIPNFKLNDSDKFPTFGESVFLPDGKPLTVTLVSRT